jgi:DNA-binding response OmpR family regulator
MSLREKLESCGPKVYVSDIKWNHEQHTIMIGKVTVALTATEYRLLLPLRHGVPVTYADLAMMAYNYQVDDKVRVMMDKHIDRIRGKLRGTGMYVYCVLNYGYLLFTEAETNRNLYDLSSGRKIGIRHRNSKQ